MVLRYAGSPEDLPDRGDMLARPGLDILRDILEGRLAGAAMWQTLGIWPVSAARGRVTFRGRPDFAVTNPAGGVHGGWYGTILDSCMACAVMTCVPAGAHYTTLEFKVNITRAIPPGTMVEAVGEVQHSGRSTGVAQGALRSVGEDRLYATGSTTCMILQS